ncbi:sensor histidine kinase [Amycolatopsis sp. cmx-4-68]|uniref:sensor histidine kinase n=1 Tax=Amycolatopsis sp. cmx-4-68 TaxID=2790938 RepID=UPI00397C8608
MTSPVTAPTAPDELTVTSEPRGTSAMDRRPRLAQHLATAIVTVVFLLGNLNVMIGVVGKAVSPLTAAYGVLSAFALVAIQVLHFGRQNTRLNSPLSRVFLLVQAGLAYLPLLTFGLTWIGDISFVAGGVLLVLRPRAAWPAFAVIAASVAVLTSQVFGTSAIDTLYATMNISYYGLVIYLLSMLARSVSALHRARSELARRAVAEQRLTFAKDLHDLLGLSLSAIALKGELVHRLIRKSADLAKSELAEITGIAQRTLSDVRSVARGYRELSLERESRTAESLLAASDIAVRVHLDQGSLPAHTRTLLAKVLREGVTDVLRHIDVEQCEITVRHHGRRVSLDIANDGVFDGETPGGPAGADARPSVRALFAEVESLGGSVSTGCGDDGRFHLHLELPLREEPEEVRDAGPAKSSHTDARRTRRLLTAIFVLMAGQSAAHELQIITGFWEATFGVGCIAALIILQLTYFNRPTTRLRSAQSYGLLFVQAALTYLPVIPLQHHWASLPGLLSGCALLVLPPAAGWLVFAANTTLYVGIQTALGTSTTLTIFYSTGAVLSGLVVFGLIWQVRLVTELEATRRRLAETALAEERLRFARDLHDLLGMTLSAIALKSELTSRILAIDRDRATVELEEILDLTRQALADVRSVASGNRELSLESESQSARSVLAAADVRVRLEMIEGELPGPVRTVLAVVLREGVTNVLRHSKVGQCEIAVRRTPEGVSLDIVNDGVEQDAAGAPAPRRAPVPDEGPSGSGIGNMSHRVSNLGGRLTAGVDPDGRFRLRAVVPV